MPVSSNEAANNDECYTEGICEDGAAILCNGQMMPISDILATLNNIAHLQHEIDMLTKGGVVEVAVRNPSVMEYMRHWEGRAEKAEAALSLPQAPDGYRLVPIEPTMAMLNAAIDTDRFKLGDISPLGFRMSPQRMFERCWQAMLAASPDPEGL